MSLSLLWCRILNIYRLEQPLLDFYPIFFHLPLIKPSLLHPLLLFNGFNWLFNAWHSRVPHWSELIKSSSVWAFTISNDVFKAWLKKQSQHWQTSGGLLCKVVWLAESSITILIPLLLPAQHSVQLNAPVCISAGLFVSDFPMCAQVCMHLFMNMSC